METLLLPYSFSSSETSGISYSSRAVAQLNPYLGHTEREFFYQQCIMIILLRMVYNGRQLFDQELAMRLNV